MDNFNIDVNGCAGYNIGDEYFVVLVNDNCSIPSIGSPLEGTNLVTPYKVIRTKIAGMYITGSEYHTILHIQWDIPDEDHMIVGPYTDSTILLNKEGKVFEKQGLKFSPKEVGAVNMFHQDKLKSLKKLNDVRAKLNADIKKYYALLAAADRFLVNVIDEIDKLNERTEEVYEYTA